MVNRRLAFVGLETDTTSACLSMLKIMNGRSSVEWQQSEPGDADVLMIANDDPAARQKWQDTDKPCIVIYHNNEDKPSARYTLSHPFRVMQLINVLEDISGSLDDAPAAQTSAKPESGKIPVDDETSEFSTSLYQAVTRDDKHSIYESHGPEGTLFVSPSTGAYFIQEPLYRKLKAKSATLSALKPVNQADLTQHIKRPLAELAWMTAQFSKTLPSWLPSDGQFRLKRWLNVNQARTNRAYLSMSAMLTRQPCRREQLAAHAGCEQDQVDRFLSACAMCDLLVCESAGKSPAPPPKAADPETHRLGSFIQGLRHRLGLSS